MPHVCRNCGHPVTLSDLDRAEILRRHDAGESAAAIAAALKVSKRSVYRVTDARRNPDEDPDQLRPPLPAPQGPAEGF